MGVGWGGGGGGNAYESPKGICMNKSSAQVEILNHIFWGRGLIFKIGKSKFSLETAQRFKEIGASYERRGRGTLVWLLQPLRKSVFFWQWGARGQDESPKRNEDLKNEGMNGQPKNEMFWDYVP